MNNTSKKAFVACLFLFLALVPAYAYFFKETFYLTLFGRIMVYAIAASAVNLLVGYTGLVSLGHALFLAIGAYAVGISSFHGLTNGWAHISVALIVSAIVAFLTGLIVLRTTGMAFIMITLAFAQMAFYLGISLKQYGGDDGIRLEARSAMMPFDLANNYVLYGLIFVFLCLTTYGLYRLVQSPFGYTLRGIKQNERRMLSMGYNVRGYKLAAYVISAMITSIAGFLLANLTSYTSPSYSAWTVSGDMVVMIVLGGMGTIIGPIVGAAGLLLFEEWLSGLTQHWMAPLGIAIVLIVLTARQGIYGSLFRDKNQSTGGGH
jgi:branched-chain amino acid transport system permease protein